MLVRACGFRWTLVVMSLVLGICGTTMADEIWVTQSDNGKLETKALVLNASPDLAVNDDGVKGFEVAADIPGFRLAQEETKGGQFVRIDWAESAFTGEIGQPMLPVIRKLLVVPTGADIQLSVEEGRALTLDSDALGYDLDLMPRQAPVAKLPGAKEAAPFDYDPTAYARDTAFPSVRAIVKELGIMRGQRLAMLEMYPVAYNAAAKQVTFWPGLVANVSFVGADKSMPATKAMPGLKGSVINPSVVPMSLRAGGDYLIVVGTALQSTIAPFAAAKQAQGFNVTTHVVSSGVTNTAIKSYIQGLWDAGNAPDYILLVGDTDTIPYWIGGGDGTPHTDLQYSCMDGSSDWYPDIPYGRFSARTTAQLQAIIDKTLYYENGPLADSTYLNRAVFMASTDNSSVTEGTHNYVVDTHMDPNDYISTKLYYADGATTQQVRDAFNGGVFYGIYSGHGGNNSWADGPPFSETDVNNLTNTNMYPFVMSFACVTGSYQDTQCFTETWSRAPNKGAVAIYGSSVNSWWTEDDVLEKRLFDVIFDLDDNVPSEVGPVWLETLTRYLSEMGSNDETRRYFEMYNLLGDPSLKFPGACSDAGSVALDKTKYTFGEIVNITVGDCGLNTDDGVVETITVDVDSDSEMNVEQVVLTETDAGSAEFAGWIQISDTDFAGVLQVANGDTITVTYIDADDGMGGTNVTVTGTAVVDTEAPVISNVRAVNIEPRAATVTFAANEPVRGTVHYGDSCAALTETASGSGYQVNPTVTLTGLVAEHTYYYSVEATDEAENGSSDDNGGMCYSFTTPAIPNFYTELFESGFDLENKKLTFTPNGTYDYYTGCVEDITELPTDPSTGTALTTLTDDSYGTITLTGGKEVNLYGQTYNMFYPVSNGYITFVHGATDYSETLEEHFGGVPKICALYDDLDPTDGGAVKWEQFDDRAVVTWDGVPEHNETAPNTFQIEMYFDGVITISYLAIDSDECITGLSRGIGLDPDYEETDLSAMGDCGPQVPRAYDGTAVTKANESVMITLLGWDDGLPDPPAAVDYIVTAIPGHGSLYDPNGGEITTVPYTVLAGGNVVEYVPDTNYYGPDALHFKLNDGGIPEENGGDSEIATVTISVVANPPSTQNVNRNMDINTSATITLDGSDIDGDELDYVIVTLPDYGQLSDPGAGVISTTPYILVNNGANVIYTPDTDYAGPDHFSYRAEDAIFNSNLSTVSLLVIADEPQITTATLPDGSLGAAYGPVQLQVSGGQPDVVWSLVTDLNYVETDKGGSQFGEVGVAQNWHKDEGFWLYTMPFDFPFYGETYTSIRIRPNGFINMGTFVGSASVNSDSGLISNIMIAPMWDDFRTTEAGEDVFIDESVAGEVTIRWKGSAIAPGNAAVDFAVVLRDDGSIRFDYGATNADVTPTIGVSAGDGVNYTLASISGATALTNANSLTFKIPVSMPDGLSLDSSGVLSGNPLEAGDFEPVFKVVDDLGREDQRLINLHVSEFGAGNCDYDGDEDVDLADYAGFQVCFTGDGNGPVAAGCEVFFADADGDIDLVDYAGFVTAMDAE